MTTTGVRSPADDEPRPAAIDHCRHWGGMARQWTQLQPPLRPHAADLAQMNRLIADHRHRTPQAPWRVLQLGSTPELTELDWPPGSELIAVDRSAEMLTCVWPGDRPGRRAVCGEWLDALDHSRGYNIVIGDCALTSQRFPEQWQRLANAIKATLKPDGLMILRCRVLGPIHEAPERVLQELRTNRIADFAAFKLRLTMSLQASPGAGIRLSDVWDYWRGCRLDSVTVAREQGWSPDEVRTIDLYRNSAVELTFPTDDQVQSLFSQVLRLKAVSAGDYPLGERHRIYAWTQ